MRVCPELESWVVQVNAATTDNCTHEPLDSLLESSDSSHMRLVPTAGRHVLYQRRGAYREHWNVIHLLADFSLIKLTTSKWQFKGESLAHSRLITKLETGLQCSYTCLNIEPLVSGRYTKKRALKGMIVFDLESWHVCYASCKHMTSSSLSLIKTVS